MTLSSDGTTLGGSTEYTAPVYHDRGAESAYCAAGVALVVGGGAALPPGEGSFAAGVAPVFGGGTVVPSGKRTLFTGTVFNIRHKY